jgi:hypothetical protein
VRKYTYKAFNKTSETVTKQMESETIPNHEGKEFKFQEDIINFISCL